MEAVATCRPGLEAVVDAELRDLGIPSPETGKRAVTFRCDAAGLYRVNMGLRAAVQVLVPIRTFRAKDYDLLYHQCRKTPWHKLFGPDKSLRIDVSGKSANLRNSQYVTHRIKDAIVDTFKKLHSGARPNVEKREPDIHVVAHLNQDEVTLCLDSSGVPLFKRGYRTEHGEAPIKEDLAAGILLCSGYQPGQALVDPVCGSGTFLFEGWMIERQIAPNLNRTFAFQHWADYEPETHAAARLFLRERQRSDSPAGFVGGDYDSEVIRIAEMIRDQHFPDACISFHHSDLGDLEGEYPGGLMVANPPYGERIGNYETIGELYRSLGFTAKRMVPGGKLAVFTTNRPAARKIRLSQERTRTLFNGSLEGLLYEFLLRDHKMTSATSNLIVFDCDSTLSAIEGIDELGALRSPEIAQQVVELTTRAMSGDIPVDKVFPIRMDLIRPTRDECLAIGQRYIEHAEPDARALIADLKANGWTVVILSGGFLPVILPFAEWLGVEHVEAVPLHFDEQGKYRDFGRDFPTTRDGGKPELIAALKQRYQPAVTVMVGDGASDLETQPHVDCFVGFGRYAVRPKVKANARHYITRLDQLPAILLGLIH